jgi:lipoprotein-releasing system permease protein
MTLPLLIARRYFLSRKKTSFINIIALISMLGVCVGTMALVIVLSVFNGLEDFNRSLFKTFDADLRITPVKGKTFAVTPALLSSVQKTAGVASVTQVYEDQALVRYANDRSAVVTIKAMDDNLRSRPEIDTALVAGRMELQHGAVNYAVLGYGVARTVGINPEDPVTPLEIWYPRRGVQLANATQDAFNQATIQPGGVFSIEQSFDDHYVFVPLRFAESLFDTGNRRSALEVQVRNGTDVETVQSRLRDQLGETFRVQNQDEQHAGLFRAIQIEKLFVFVTLIFIVAIASFNIFFSLTMLTIEKKEDVATLFAMGAWPGLIRRIFLAEGALVAFSGAFVGLIAGVAICWLQQQYGMVKMNLADSLVDAYPVRMKVSDLAGVVTALILITLAASWIPASRAARQAD